MHWKPLEQALRNTIVQQSFEKGTDYGKGVISWIRKSPQCLIVEKFH